MRQSQGVANGDTMDSDDDSDDEAGGGTCMSAADFQRAVASELGRIEEGSGDEQGRKEAGGEEAEVVSMVDEDGFMLVQTGKAAKKKGGRK